MKRRLLIITEIIAPYRIPVFNALSRHPEIDLQVVFLAENDPAVRQWRIYRDEIAFSYDILPSWRKRFGQHHILVNQNVSLALQDSAPEVIVCGGYNYLASWQAQRWARNNNVPFLLWCESTVGDQRAEYPLVESLKRRFFSKCDGFVVPGKAAETYVRKLADAEKRVFFAPNAIDNRLFAENAQAARNNASRLKGQLGLPSRYFLFVGRLVKSKGILDLVEAYACLDDEVRSEIGLVIAGDGPLRAELQSRGRTIFPGAVHLPGFIHRDELAVYYALGECFVFPSHTDPWGLVVNEAMACGLPIICSEVAGCAADLVKTNGWTTLPGDVAALASAMAELAADRSLRENMSVASRQIISNYSPAACAQGIANAALFPEYRNHISQSNGNEEQWLRHFSAV